jgi:3-dehydroquinate dehydratase-2
LTTTSVSVLDALFTVEVPVIEVHITNIHAREEFRRNSYVSLAARAVVCGFGIEGYALSISGLAALTGAKV